MNPTPLFYTSHPITHNSRDLQDMATNASSMRKFFQEFNDRRRDLDEECGYPINTDNPENYRTLYDRMAIARRVVELMPKECWQVQPLVFETEDPEDVTDFELAWDNLGKSLRGEASWYQDEAGSPVWEYLKRVDIMSGIGRFGVLLLGIDDGLNLDQPADGAVAMSRNGEGRLFHAPSKPTVNRASFHAGRFSKEKGSPEDYLPPLCNPCFNASEETAKQALEAEEKAVLNLVATYENTYGGTGQESYGGIQGTDAQYVGTQLSPSQLPSTKPSKKKRSLLFLRVFDESLVQIVQYEADLRNPRFGKPVMYRITLNDPRDQASGIGLPIATVRVHWSRVIHIADNLQCSEVMGAPRMKPVLNNILDLRKIYGASPEGYWKNACGGLQFKTHPQMGGDVSVDVSKLRDTVENWQNSQQKYLLGIGGEWNTIMGNVIDPGPHIKVQIQAICICYGWPENIFMGTQTGVLAGDKDSEAFYLRRVPERQLNNITPRIIIPFTDRLIQLGVLPEPKHNRQGEENEDEEQESGEVIANKSNDRLSPGVYRRVRVKRVVVMNADTGLPEVKEKEVGSTVVKTSGGYSIEWPDLDSMSEKDKAAIFAQRTTAYGTYISMGIENLIPPKVFMTEFDDMEDSQAEAIIDMAAEANESEDMMTTTPMEGGYEMAPEEGDADFEPEPEPESPTPIKVKEGEKLVHPDDITPTENVFCATGSGGGSDPTCSVEDHHLQAASDARKTSDHYRREGRKMGRLGLHEAATAHRQAAKAAKVVAEKHEELHRTKESYRTDVASQLQRKQAADSVVSDAEKRVEVAKHKEEVAKKRVEDLKQGEDPKERIAKLRSQLKSKKK